jgi:polar amino acid transport system substrate-binding protein
LSQGRTARPDGNADHRKPRTTWLSAHAPRLGVAAALAAAAVGAGCSEASKVAENTFEPASPGEVVVATSLPSPGFWEGDDVATLDGGFEWGLARALADALGLRVSFRDVPFPDIVTGDLHGADLALAQVSITGDREDRVQFSVPYFDSAPAVLAPRDAGDIHDLATARDRSWVVERGTTERAFVDDVVRPDEPAVAVDGEAEAVDAVRSGDADAALLDLPAALVIAAQVPELEVHARFDDPERYGVVLPEDSPDINRRAIDKALRGLLADGTVADLADRWLQPVFASEPDDIPVIQTS